ncbi:MULTISPECIES: vWA domain-containing protein [Pseudanabaena]|uniref:von Willebrand factor type A n=2 Tax=Pseudanabaena TaxID=1152 RepID=L8MW62_9CYAN|nr:MULTISPECIES: VWA domain-containing protein [Pseudanabaena]ELS32202.1 von Willebrand factor type A [Pseudanabaena biceps PCC 7429]MDG3495541.1 VWA domain-containing protein [Pseudanabaena catenata USMAC16]
MSVNLTCKLSDRLLDSNQGSSQRQLAISVSANASVDGNNAPLNLCLVLDHSGSMGGQPLDTVKRAARDLVDRMHLQDRISVIGFDHKAHVVVENQLVDRTESIKEKIQSLKASGGTCIDDGIKLGLQETSKGKDGTVSQLFVLTDGENEHGDNERCLQFSRLATEYNMTLHSLGFGDSWNQDVLERIADAGGGAMAYIASPAAASEEFQKLLKRVQAIGLTNAHLVLQLAPYVRLAELKPIAQVSPDTIELPYQTEGNAIIVRLGDLMTDVERVVLFNLYISPASYIAENPASSTIPILTAQVRYDIPSLAQINSLSDPVTITAELVQDFTPQLDSQVQNHLLALAKYRQTQLAEQKLQQGDRAGAATMLQSAAKTALQMGDYNASTILQNNATRLQTGTALSESERKKTRIASKTVLQTPPNP